ncbi:MAG: SDR family NAD(P)-dependent oxidoreductase [Alphaproteobacteria bacterium]|nr:SDR family NAD(P)-dependent oxidoreductase [Alphaproteobacteria bacterium]
MSRRFADQVVWITGGGSGIGRALAMAFGQEGAIVAVTGRRQERLDEVVAALEAAGAQGLAVPCDVTSEPQLDAAVQQILDAHGRLDVCIANAGFSVAGRIEALSAEDWHRQLSVNVVGLAMTARYALPALRETRGRLALIGSVAAYVSGPGFGAYSASKAAVRSMGDTLYLELAGSGVSCTTIHPGFVESEIAQVDNHGRFNPEAVDKRPRQLMWKAEDAARVMVRGVAARRREVVVTGHGVLGVWLARFFPGLTLALTRRFQ